jgi:hypothetical protein
MFPAVVLLACSIHLTSKPKGIYLEVEAAEQAGTIHPAIPSHRSAASLPDYHSHFLRQSTLLSHTDENKPTCQRSTRYPTLLCDLPDKTLKYGRVFSNDCSPLSVSIALRGSGRHSRPENSELVLTQSYLRTASYESSKEYRLRFHCPHQEVLHRFRREAPV